MTQVRPPLTEDDLAERRPYYSEADISAILSTFNQRPDFDRDRFYRDMESAASWYVMTTAGKPSAARAPSTRVKDWRGLGARLSDALDGLHGLDRYQQNDLIEAGDDLAKMDRGLPDFEGESINLPAEENAPADVVMTWPAKQQIDKAIDELEWLIRCVECAATRAERTKTGSGRQPDEPLHIFTRQVIALLHETSAETVKRPGTDRASNKRQGVMLDFLDALLRPLRPYELRARERRFQELYGIIWRAIEPNPLPTE